MNIIYSAIFDIDEVPNKFIYSIIPSSINCIMSYTYLPYNMLIMSYLPCNK
jgi:hypothetical protein